MIFLAAILGYSISGYTGALIGAAMAWVVKSAMKSSFANQQNEATGQFLNSLFSMLAKIAKADGIISKEEIDAVTRFMDTIKLNNEDKKIAINAFRNASSDERSIYEYASQYQAVASKEMREITYAVLWDVAYSDGVIHPQEEDILRKIPQYLGLNGNIYHKYSNTSSSNTNQTSGIDEHYELLNCTQTSTDKEIKRGYRKAIGAYHPDKIQAKGLPKEFMDFANEQSKKINKAYDAIKKSRSL
ncbi:MAG: Co-chaperone protein DjlA [Catillopecten margaritatus gill symbiont]|uniref:Co-chaperone protein DjlA n=1 Tax=Catillopecten margaritatus gill symbiont TaxID=3083288 RepID=A0AAU6PIR6_9GAMM